MGPTCLRTLYLTRDKELSDGGGDVEKGQQARPPRGTAAGRQATHAHNKMWAVARHLARFVDVLPALPRRQAKERFYLHELGLTYECQESCPAWSKLLLVIRRRESELRLPKHCP
jgi:hypothetical protein